MARARKNKQPTEAEPTAEPQHGAIANEAVEPDPEGEQPRPDEHADKPVARGQFRSWIVDQEFGYTRMTDEINRLLILQFAERPGEDILAAVKEAGFQFKPDHFGQLRVWVRKNDFAGRVHVERIESLVREGRDKEASPDF